VLDPATGSRGFPLNGITRCPLELKAARSRFGAACGDFFPASASWIGTWSALELALYCAPGGEDHVRQLGLWPTDTSSRRRFLTPPGGSG